MTPKEHPVQTMRRDAGKGAHTAWNVYRGSRLLTTVFYTADCDAEYVKRGLVDHDGFAPDIRIFRQKP